MTNDVPPEISSRRHQMFPVLTAPEIARIRRFGTVHHYERGTRLFAAGEPGPGMFVVLKGSIAISQHDGLGHIVPVVRHEPGEFSAEVGQLSGGQALVDGYADEDLEALLVPPAQLRALIIAEADLGERIVRALILRRVGLIESGGSGPVLIGGPESRSCSGYGTSSAATASHISPSTPRRTAQPPRCWSSTARPRPTCWWCAPMAWHWSIPLTTRLRAALEWSIRPSATSSTTSSSLAPARRDSRLPCTRLRKACTSSYWTVGRMVDRRGPARELKTTWAFPPASPVRRSRAAPSSRRKNSAPRS